MNRTSVVVVYAAVVASLVAGIGVALFIVTNSVASPQSARTRTALDMRLESAREVREALAKPIPQPQRLPPVTAKKQVAKAATRSATPKSSSELAMRDPRQAFVSIKEPPTTFAEPFFGLMSFGPGAR
jgi:hypothetical protein